MSDNVIPIHEGRPTVVDEQLQAEAAEADIRDRIETDDPSGGHDPNEPEYAAAGTQAGGPKSLMQRLQEHAEEVEEKATRLHQASEDPENDEEVRAAFAEYADLINQIGILEQQQTPTVQWDDLSVDDKLNALATSQIETQKQIHFLGTKLEEFGQVLFRILVKAGEMDEEGNFTGGTEGEVKRTESGIVLPS